MTRDGERKYIKLAFYYYGIYSIILRRLHSIILPGSTTPLKTPCIMQKAVKNTSTRAKEIFINFVSNVINGLTVNDDSKLYLTYPNH